MSRITESFKGNRKVKTHHSSIHPPTHPFTYPSKHLSTYSSIHPPIHPPIHPSTYLFIHPPFHPFIYPSTYLSIHLSIHPSTHPSIPSCIPQMLIEGLLCVRHSVRHCISGVHRIVCLSSWSISEGDKTNCPCFFQQSGFCNPQLLNRAI